MLQKIKYFYTTNKMVVLVGVGLVLAFFIYKKVKK